MKCPKCNSTAIYFREKTQTFQCIHCLSGIEEPIINVPVSLSQDKINELVLENNQMLHQLLELSKK